MTIPDWSGDVLQVDPSGHWPQLADYQRACDASMSDLNLANRLQPFSEDVPNVVCVVRNEQRRLPGFLRHYDGLGAECIHIIDNGSTDKTAEIALAHPKVTLWRTGASYAGANFGQLWTGGLVRQHGLGKWVLNVDADELLVYPGDEQKKLHALASWLASRNMTRLCAPMIDMYGGPPLFTRIQRFFGLGVKVDAPLVAQAPYFDACKTARDSAYQFEETTLGIHATGGPRSRLLLEVNDRDSAFCLSKHPLALWDEQTAYANVHFPYPFNQNPKQVFGALLHFKFLDDFPQRVKAILAENQHWNDSLEYRKYDDWISGQTAPTLYSRNFSARYASSHSLVAQGIIQNIDWD